MMFEESEVVRLDELGTHLPILEEILCDMDTRFLWFESKYLDL